MRHVHERGRTSRAGVIRGSLTATAVGTFPVRRTVSMKSVEALVDDPDGDGDAENIRDWCLDAHADADEMWELLSSDDELLDRGNDDFGAQYDTYDLGE